MTPMTDAEIAELRAGLAKGWCPFNGEEANATIRALLARLDAAEGGWMPIESAPEDPDLLVEVYAPAREGLKAIVCACQWHPDAGHCVDEIRYVTHWRPLSHPKEGS